MTIRTIKPGKWTPPVFRGRCDQCGAEFECDEIDVHRTVLTDCRGKPEDYLYEISCQTARCGTVVLEHLSVLLMISRRATSDL